jgi:hypothetical protein
MRVAMLLCVLVLAACTNVYEEPAPPARADAPPQFRVKSSLIGVYVDEPRRVVCYTLIINARPAISCVNADPQP